MRSRSRSLPDTYVTEFPVAGVVKVGGVDCDEEKSLPSQYGVQGFPTVKIFYGGKSEDYQGPRTAKGVVEAALKAARTLVENRLGGKTSGGGSGGDSGNFPN